MRGLLLLFLAGACISAQTGVQAGIPERCPLLNNGTASGVLGGAVKATVSHAPHNDGVTCLFTLERDSIISTLKIEVKTMTSPATEFATYKARCPSADAVALKAIGNEAIACRFEAGVKQKVEQVFARVREHALVVQAGTNDLSVQPAALREKARSVAEQAAGSLF